MAKLMQIICECALIAHISVDNLFNGGITNTFTFGEHGQFLLVPMRFTPSEGPKGFVN